MMDIADGLAAEVYFAQLAFLASDDCDGSRCQEHALPELYRRHIQQMRQCHTGDARWQKQTMTASRFVSSEA